MKKYLTYFLMFRKHNKYTSNDSNFIVIFFNVNFFFSQFGSTYKEMETNRAFNA